MKEIRVGIIGTRATVASGSYQAALRQLLPQIECFAAPCPLFVPLVEEGHILPEDQLATLAAAQYLGPMKQNGIDTLIMGCTHYALLEEVIRLEMGSGVTLVDPGRETAIALKQSLEQDGLLNSRESGGSLQCYVSDMPQQFERIANLFLGSGSADETQVVDIEEYKF